MGVGAVVDKDYVAAMLGIAVGADRLLVLTDVSAVMTDFGTPNAAPLSYVSLDELAGMSFPGRVDGTQDRGLPTVRGRHGWVSLDRFADRRRGPASRNSGHHHHQHRPPRSRIA